MKKELEDTNAERVVTVKRAYLKGSVWPFPVWLSWLEHTPEGAVFDS